MRCWTGRKTGASLASERCERLEKVSLPRCSGGSPGRRAHGRAAHIVGKLALLRVECTRCSRKGQYKVAKLIAEYGREGNMVEWMSDLKGDCPRRDAPQLHERCDLICPDLPKVL